MLNLTSTYPSNHNSEYCIDLNVKTIHKLVSEQNCNDLDMNKKLKCLIVNVIHFNKLFYYTNVHCIRGNANNAKTIRTLAISVCI